MTFVPEPPDLDKRKSEQPHFEIQVGDGRGLLLLRPRTFFGWLRVDSLQLAIAEVQFPLDITGGMAQFQRQRCPVLEATITIERAGFAELVQRRASLLAAAGFAGVGIELSADGIELSAQARLREWTAELFVRIAVEVEERTVRLRVVEAATFGFIRRPAALLAHDLLCVLVGASTTPTNEAAPIQSATTRGLGVVQLRPLDWFVVSVLAPAGWRLPELEGLRLEGVALTARGASLRWARSSEEEGATETATAGAATGGVATRTQPRSVRGVVDELAARAIDEALLRNNLAGAASACRLEMTRRPERTLALTEQLLAILCTRDASLREAEKMARDALARWPELGSAHLALASVESSRGNAAEAARHFSETARMAEARGQLVLAVRAGGGGGAAAANDRSRARGAALRARARAAADGSRSDRRARRALRRGWPLGGAAAPVARAAVGRARRRRAARGAPARGRAVVSPAAGSRRRRAAICRRQRRWRRAIDASGSSWRRCATPPATWPDRSPRSSSSWSCWRRAAIGSPRRARCCASPTTTTASATTRRRCAAIARRWR